VAELEVDGLDETAAAFGRIGREIERVLDRALGLEMRRTYRESQSRLNSREGAGNARYRRDQRDLELDTQRLVQAHEIVLRPGGTMLGAEFGAYRTWIFGRVGNVKTLFRNRSRPQFGLWSSEPKIVGPLFEPRAREVRRTERELDREIDRETTRALNRAGVPRG